MNYQRLLSPVRIGDVVLKSRMVASNSLPHFTQGPETYPNDAIIEYLAGIAANGAAIVTFADWSDASLRSFGGMGGNGGGDICHFPVYDLSDPATENVMNQLTDAIHFHGSKASLALSICAPKGYGVYSHKDTVLPDVFEDMMDPDEPLPPMMEKLLKPGLAQNVAGRVLSKMASGKGMPPLPFALGPEKALGPKQMRAVIDQALDRIRYYRDCGFDMVTLHAAYRSTLLANFLSPITNMRDDDYGGSLENRARFPLELCAAIKEEFGRDFLIEMQVSGEDGKPGGFTVDDLVAFAKLAEGTVDILQIRAGNGDDAHPTGFNSREHEPLTLAYSAAVCESGARIIVEPIGGYQDPDDMERWLAEGKAHMFGMARAFICDFDYYRKLVEGRGKDVLPCIRCNRCHGLHESGPWLTVCSVNPRMGVEHRLGTLVDVRATPKRVAVIGGGPAGMEAAITAADRGHEVVLFEGEESLGGQLRHTDFVSFKWPLRNFKDFLIEQVAKRPIDVRLGSRPSPEELASEGFDAVLAATGAMPALPSVEGVVDGSGRLAEGLWKPLAVYGREEELGQRIVIVGGSDIGVETGMYLAGCGHEVTVLTRRGRLAVASNRVHYYSSMRRYWKGESGFTGITRATTVAVAPDSVDCIDEDGAKQRIGCDSVIVCGGMASQIDDALAYARCAPVFRMIGDCAKTGNVQTAIRAGFAAASSI